jgi:hypothetical protein
MLMNTWTCGQRAPEVWTRSVDVISIEGTKEVRVDEVTHITAHSDYGWTRTQT